MIKPAFTQEEANNLLTFLNRTDLKGGEVPAFVAIITKLQKAIKEGEENEQ